MAIAAVFCLAVWAGAPAGGCAAPLAVCGLLAAAGLLDGRAAARREQLRLLAGQSEYSELYYFCRTAAATVVNAPEGYTDDTVTQLTAEYTGRTGEMQPNIIMIMNESFADLGTLVSSRPMRTICRMCAACWTERKTRSAAA